MPADARHPAESVAQTKIVGDYGEKLRRAIADRQQESRFLWIGAISADNAVIAGLVGHEFLKLLA